MRMSRTLGVEGMVRSCPGELVADKGMVEIEVQEEIIELDMSVKNMFQAQGSIFSLGNRAWNRTGLHTSSIHSCQGGIKDPGWSGKTRTAG